jgi:NAD(P)-dependent dehydrogenase (short-subunit alcohol dehydrogenase family)
MRRGITVVITGASAGIGRAIAREYGRKGARVALLARGREGLEGAAREIEELGGEALAIVCDVADDQAVEEAASRIEDQFGPIDIWINNAMASMFAPAEQMQAGDFRRITDVTYLGAVYGTLAALKRMKPRNRGTIVQVGSLLARRSIPLQSAYCAAKHALEGFTESLRCELMHDKSNIQLTMVHLPAVNTPQFSWVKTTLPRAPQPMGKIYQPEVAARAIVEAADHPRRTVLAGGSMLLPWFAQKIAPGVLDRVLAKKGVEGQQSPTEHVLADHRHNLWVPVPGDHGAHGRFDATSTSKSMQLWANRHRRRLGVLALALAAVTWRLRRARAART